MPLFEMENQTSGLHLVYTLRAEETLDTVGFEMCTHHQLPPELAPMLFSQTDDQKRLKYRVPTGKTLKQLCFDRVRTDTLIRIFCTILQTLAACEDYMLVADQILLDADYIFVTPSADNICLIYLPIRERAKTPDLNGFFRGILSTARFDLAADSRKITEMLNFLNARASVSVSDALSFFKNLSTNPTMHGGEPKRIERKELPSSLVSSAVPAKAPSELTPKSLKSPLSVPTAPPKTPGEGSAASEKEISLFYLLQHYNSDNAAAYKAQKEKKKKLKKGSAPIAAAPKSPAPKASFAIPGSDTFPAKLPQESPTPPMSTPIPTPPTPPMSTPMPMPPTPTPLPTPPTPSTPTPPPTPPTPSAVGTTPLVPDMEPDSATVILSQSTPFLLRRATGESIPIGKEDFWFGRASHSGPVDYDLSPLLQIGRRHCHLLTVQNNCFIVDNHSQNHTFLNGAVLTPEQAVLLKDGDILRLADEEFEFHS